MESFSGLLRAVMNHTDTCILVCDAETQEILYATDTIKEFIPETEAEALIGKNCQELFDKCPEWRGFRFADKIRSGKEYDLEEYFEHRKKCWAIHGREIEFEGHKVMAHYFYDVTAEHRIRTNLRNRYYSEITLMSDVSPYALGMYRLNLSQNKMEIPLGKMPEGMELLYPMSVDAFFRFLAERCARKEDSENFMNMFNRRKLMHEYERGRTHFSMEHTFYMVTDQVMWITTAISTAKNVDTGDVEAVLYSVDVFRAKIVEELLGAVSENDYDGVYLIDAKHSRAYKFSDIRRNPGGDIKENGVEYKTLLNRLMTRVPKDSDGYFEVFEMLALENIRRELHHRSNYTVYYETTGKDGRTRHKKATFYTVDIPGDLICGTVQDISGVIENAMEREAELQDALNKVQNALNSRNSILSRLSRDIRSPLSSIIGFAEIARSEIPDDTREAVYLDNIITAGASIHTIIDDMLTLHQIDRKGVVLAPERLDLAEFFGILEAKMLPSASERGLTFSVELGNHVPQQIMADRYRLEQVLTRLLENTFDYNANGGNVRLLVTEQKRESNRTTLRFAISDSSTGVNAEYLSSIFEPVDPKVIVQVDSPDQLDLGLTLAKSNVAAMGGRVEAQSLDDQGSCVTVTMTFPISYDRNETFTRLPAETSRKYSFKRGRVLLVDDHKISLEIGVKMLEKAGLDVDTAMNGEEALDAFRKAEGAYDLILMDIQMPLVDGLEATRKIRSEKNIGGDQVPIIAMTANAFEEDVKGSFAAGMNEHLTKPFSPQELYAVMSKFIG
ncbi:MAG TPA: hypothetical protein DCX23_07295 [Lachnospiraceae bacterium]|nr:hypothetical protein [Lachnospiraceae bacterium]